MPQCRWKWRYPHFPSERKCHPGRPAWLQTGWAGYETPRMSQGSNVIVNKTKMTCKSTITVPLLAPGLQLKIFSRLRKATGEAPYTGQVPWMLGNLAKLTSSCTVGPTINSFTAVQDLTLTLEVAPSNPLSPQKRVVTLAAGSHTSPVHSPVGIFVKYQATYFPVSFTHKFWDPQGLSMT